MSQTLVYDAYEAYLAIIKAAVPANVTVFDGPQPIWPTEASYVAVGVPDPMQDGVQTAIDSGSQDWESLGAGSRQELFTIWSSLFVWSGDVTFPTLRATSKTILADIHAALRPPPAGTGDAMLNNTLNQGGNGTGWILGLAVTRVQLLQDSNGAAVITQFPLISTALL